MHPNFYLSKELLPISQFHRADHYTKKVFEWIPDLKLGNAFGIFCLEWGDEFVLKSIPKNYDAYLITPGTEYVDWVWIKKFCKSVPDSKVIVICPYQSMLYAETNLSILTFDVWPFNLKFYLEEFQQTKISYRNRKYKISSLANRICQMRVYVCAYLHRTWNSDDYIMSWRKFLGKQEDLYLLEQTGTPKIDDTIEYIKNVFWDITIKIDDFVNQPVNNLNYNHPPYTDCVINCSNESINNSYQFINGNQHIQPGPYLTEKTYKNLLSGTALFAVGQYQTYGYLESQGFNFDYPWDRSYDLQAGDIDRAKLVLDCLDSIRVMTLDHLEESTIESRMHNREYILSGDYFQHVNKMNQKNIDEFSKT